MRVHDTYPGWHKDPDGQWRHPRYPKGQARPHGTVSLTYDQEGNGATLTVEDRNIRLTFGELQALMSQGHQVVTQAQAENSRLWAQKAEILRLEEGINPSPARGHRGRPRRR